MTWRKSKNEEERILDHSMRALCAPALAPRSISEFLPTSIARFSMRARQWTITLSSETKLSHSLLKTVYSDTCLSCAHGHFSHSDTFDMCIAQQGNAAKCEAMHGFNGGKGGGDTTNNVLIAQEAAVCNLINVVANGTDNPSDELQLPSKRNHA